MMQSEMTLLSLMDPLRFKLSPSFSNPLLLGSGAAANIVQWKADKKKAQKSYLAPPGDYFLDFLAVHKISVHMFTSGGYD